MSFPAVSVILPTYNRAKQLQRAIKSVLAQSYRDLELIIVDDCSTDQTEAELKKVVDRRVRIIRQPVNSGPGAARNAGIRAAAGRYIAFQDSDAEWFPQKLIRQIEELERCEGGTSCPAACYSRCILSSGNKELIIPSDHKAILGGRIYERLLYGNTMDTPSIVIRKDVLDQLGYFDESLRNLEDWDLALRVAHEYAVAFLDEATMISYDSPGSVNKLISPESQIVILRKHVDAYKRSPEAMANVTWQIGSSYAMRHQRDEALKYFRTSLDAFPTKARYLAYAALRGGMGPYQVVRGVRKLLHQ